LIEIFVCEEQPRRTRAEIEHTTSTLTLQLAIMKLKIKQILQFKIILAPGTQPACLVVSKNTHTAHMQLVIAALSQNPQVEVL
jgi:hypothetical protein